MEPIEVYMDSKIKFKLHKLCLKHFPNSLPYRDEAKSAYGFDYFGFGESDEVDYGLDRGAVGYCTARSLTRLPQAGFWTRKGDRNCCSQW